MKVSLDYALKLAGLSPAQFVEVIEIIRAIEETKQRAQ